MEALLNWIEEKSNLIESVKSWGRVPKDYISLQMKVVIYKEAFETLPKNIDVSEVSFNQGDNHAYIETPSHTFETGGFNTHQWWEKKNK